MKIGVCLPQIGTAATTSGIRSFAVRAEAAGVDALWVEEHLFRPLMPITGFGGVPGRPWPAEHALALSPLEILSFVAALTTRCRLGTSVLVAGYHHPLVLAKQAATIDVLSDGRMNLGLGVGWCEDEYRLLGQSFADRGTITDETLQAISACWQENPVEFHGRHVTIPASETSPKPVDGRIPLYGGFMSAAGRRRVARWCDSWHPFGIEAEEAATGVAAINTVAVHDHGRPPLTVALRVLLAPGDAPTASGPMGRSSGVWAGSFERIAERLREARAWGIDEVVMDANFASGSGDEAFWSALAEELPMLASAAHG
ncbi:MAG: TIGR03619 family F420-dependent LLM class oxidoreductase [Microbacterium sp.]